MQAWACNHEPDGIEKGVEKMARNVLSAKKVEKLSTPGRYCDGGGLDLVIDKSGRRYWIFRFQIAGRRQNMSLGSADVISLADARLAAENARGQAARGANPLLTRKRAAAAPTLSEAADAYITLRAPLWSGRETERAWRRSFALHAAALRDVPVNTLTTEDILSVLRPIWIDKAETAGKVRERVERVLDAARAAGHREGDNPARWRGHLEFMLPPRRKLTRGHHRALSYDELPAFMARLRGLSSVGARALEWTILTAGRESMTLGACWPEVSDTLWTIPPARMKDRKEHRVPLTARCLAILEEVKGLDDRRIFPGQRRAQMSDMTMDKVLVRMGVNATPHGFRSTFRDWAGDCTPHAREVVEEALAHAVGNAVERAYRRGDALEKRRRLMEDWDRYCGG